MSNNMCNSIATLKLVYLFVVCYVRVPLATSQFNNDGDNNNNNVEKQTEVYQKEVEEWLNQVDADLSKFNSLSAFLTWKLSTVPDLETSRRAMELGVARNEWKNKICDPNIRTHFLKPDQKRKLYLLCRGPRFTEELSRSYMQVMGHLTQAYNSEVCFTENDTNTWRELDTNNPDLKDIIYDGLCVYGEPDLERLMKKTDLTSDQLKWTWKIWHDFVGPKIKAFYPAAIHLQNVVARNNGYHDMGEIWREELEIPNLEVEVMNLYEDIKPLYQVLHAVVRHKLLQKHGSAVINAKGPIPVHLLGNMWGQDWSTLMDLFVPKNETINIEENLRTKNWSVPDMVRKAEDMYTSLGLPRMTEKFWKNSVFEENENTSICHGTAANLFSKDDFRMLLCAKLTMEDFYVIHHEMGHIEYYMAYQNQPAIFQDGANSAFHESVGDAVMHAVMVPQHLHRLGLLSDRNLFDKSLDLFLLLQQALNKIPELAFSVIVDKYRWNIFNGKIKPENYNRVYWELNKSIRGVVPPEHRGEEYFDAGAKFHVPDNTPYIRYFLSSIIQMEFFNSLCDLSLYGKNQNVRNATNSLKLPLHRCDIYGSKKPGRKLQEMLNLGSSQHWSKAMKILTDKEYITVQPFLDYYEPIYKWLKRYVEMYNVPVGW